MPTPSDTLLRTRVTLSIATTLVLTWVQYSMASSMGIPERYIRPRVSAMRAMMIFL